MSVIIRLQNLPWAANAADIRIYFTGLSIPEGGVHIVGGEQGDAFIAFSTDEDARQAMLLDGGKLKEVKIKLFLSSRAEMLRVIEQARQQSLTVESIIHGTAPTTTLPVPVITNNTPAAVLVVQPKKIEENKDADGKAKGVEIPRDKKDHYRSQSKERDRSRGRESKDRSRGNDPRGRNRDRDRRRRDRSRSRDRYRRRSRSRDRRRGSRDRDRDSKDHLRNRRKDSKEIEETNKNASQEMAPAVEPSWEPASQNTQKVPLLPDPPAMPPILLQMHQNGNDLPAPPTPLLNFPVQDQERRPMFPPYNPQMGPMPPYIPMRGREGWNPQLPSLMEGLPMGMPRPMMNNMDMGMQGFPPAFGMPSMIPNPNDPNNLWRPPMVQTAAPEELKLEETDVCIEVRGLPLNVSYIDVKKLFDGLSIPPDGIKMINDNHGNRTGIAYVRFNLQNHRKVALNQNGKKVRSNTVEVLNLRDSIYKAAIDNFKPEKDTTAKSVDMDIDNGENNDGGWSREREVNRDRERIRDRERDRDLPSKSRIRTKSNDPRINKANIEQNNERRTDCVILQGLPPNANENDIADFFNQVGITPVHVHFVLDNMRNPIGDAFCRFNNFEDAHKALQKHNTYIGRYVISVACAQRDEMERSIQIQQEPPAWPLPGRVGGPGPNSGLMPGGRMQTIPPLFGGPGGSGGNGDRMVEPDRHRFGGDRDNRFSSSERGGGREDRPSRFQENGRPPSIPRDRGGPPIRGRNMRGGDSYHLMGPPRGGGHHRRGGREASPYIDNNTLENFGQPGCVVSLENLHFRAEIEEIIAFFDSFVVKHENVIRRFDENGRATGDARVALNSPSEAMRAVRTLNYKTLRRRSVIVTVL